MHAIHDAGPGCERGIAKHRAITVAFFTANFVYAIDDDFFIACMCTLACAIPFNP